MLEYLHNVWQQQAGADLELGFTQSDWMFPAGFILHLRDAGVS